MVSNDSFIANDELGRTLKEADILHFRKVSPIVAAQKGKILEKTQVLAHPPQPSYRATSPVRKEEKRVNKPKSNHH